MSRIKVNCFIMQMQEWKHDVLVTVVDCTHRNACPFSHILRHCSIPIMSCCIQENSKLKPNWQLLSRQHRIWKRHAIRIRALKIAGKEYRMVVDFLDKLYKNFMWYTKLSVKKPWVMDFPLFKVDLGSMGCGNLVAKYMSLLYFINHCLNYILICEYLFWLEKKMDLSDLNLLNGRDVYNQLKV